MFARPGLGELHRPARIAVLLAQLGRLLGPAVGDLARLDGRAVRLGVALLGAATMVASTICPPMARKPAALSVASN
jgi:hypothetical protein